MKIRVKPAAHLDRLEEVLVLQTRQDLNLKKTPDAEASPAASPAARPAPAARALPTEQPSVAH
jgi:hypothetical protein